MKKYRGFIIDKITNSIEDSATGKRFETEMLPVTSHEILDVHKKDGWLFNWKQEFKNPCHKIFKLVMCGDSKIQGLISIEPIHDQFYIEMHLIETAPHNYGKHKQFIGVAEIMVAFVCKMSFEMEFNGVVAFTAKTSLINHYIKTLGAEIIFNQNRMGIFTSAAKKLVNLHYKNHFYE